ncbi:MAG: Holliday junction resolvase RuvX [Aristaeellaceae bacterium]
MNERILCLDIGDARIGVAVSDMTRLIATPIDTIYRVGWGPDTKQVVALCRQYDTTQVLAGWPLNMDGTAGFQSEKVKNFCAQLEKAGLTVYYQDERLTTVTATNALIEGNMHRAERKHNVDKVAAAVILQQWLDTQRNLQQQQQEDMKMDENIIELIDDETGESVQFLHLATLMHENKEYIAVTDAAEEDEECGVFFMEIITEDGEDSYSPVEDEKLQDVLFEQFVALMDEDDDE